VPRFDAENAQVLGISPDSVPSHVKFRDKYGLNFPLLADEGHAVADRYGVWQQKSMYGRKYWGNARTTFVIDAEGRIAKVFEKVKPAGHAAEVAAAVAALA
jgi:peroxiredoxin Q/BCP